MRSVISLVAVMLFFSTGLFAQELVYPTTEQLRSSLHQLIASAAQRCSNIDNGPMDASSPDYRRANFHLIPNSRNQLYFAAATSNDNYMEYVSEGINDKQATTGFNKWKTLFEEALPEFNFLSIRDDTYGRSIYYYDSTQTHMFVLEVYFNPVKKTWSISLRLYHPTDSDKQSIAKKNNSGNDFVARRKLISETLLGLLKARQTKFQSYRSIELTNDKGVKTFAVTGVSFGFDPGPVTFIETDTAGAVNFHMLAAGFDMPVQITVCYATLITPELEKEGYSITKTETSDKVTYTILYKEVPVSVCRMEKANGSVTLVILGE